MKCILVVRWKKIAEGVPLPLSQKRKTFCRIFIAFSQCVQNFVHFERKDQLYNLNISEIIDCEKYGYLNARKLLFQNTLRESTCSRVLNTADTSMVALSSELSIYPRDIELENISVSKIWNARTAWEYVKCRSHIFSLLDEKNLCKVFECHYLKKGNHFLEFLLHFRNLHIILSSLKEKIKLIT